MDRSEITVMSTTYIIFVNHDRGTVLFHSSRGKDAFRGDLSTGTRSINLLSIYLLVYILSVINDMSSDKPADYGALADTEASEADESFDVSNTYYLKDTSTNLTFKQRLRKLTLVASPLLVAGLIMFLFALFLRGALNSGPSAEHAGGTTVHSTSFSDTTDSSRSDTVPRGLPPSRSSKPTSASTSSRDAPSIGACSAHLACAALVGDCCPTKGGITLECCHA
jgi:hypothetical protein